MIPTSIYFSEVRLVNGYSKSLRAVIQNLNVELTESMRLRGHQQRIGEQKSENGMSRENPTAVSRADYSEEIRQLLNMTRGRELPGMFNSLIVGDLFRDQSKSWKNLA